MPPFSPGFARSTTKLQVRQRGITSFHAGREKDLERFVTYVRTPGVQANIGAYVLQLKQRSRTNQGG